MTTFAELKTRAARSLRDPSKATFTDDYLGDFINEGIVEVSRYAPQPFIEDIQLVEGQLSYPLRGGDGNLLANPSFEEGDQTMFDGAYNLVNPGDTELTGGWDVSAQLRALWTRSTNRKTGLYVGVIQQPALTADRYFYQDIPVNAGVSYGVSGWHWKSVAGGKTNAVRFHTLDSSSVIVSTDAVRHDTTSNLPQSFSGVIDVPGDGTVAYIRVILAALTGGSNATEERFAFEDIKVVEYGQGHLVADNQRNLIEVRRVEVFSYGYEPPVSIGTVPSGAGEYVSSSETGWDFWQGDLHIPYRVYTSLDRSTHFLRVWGWAPYDRLTADTQTTDLTGEMEEQVLFYARMKGLEALMLDRDLFTQWQTRSGNTDTSPAAIMNGLTIAQGQWRQRTRSFLVLRGS